MDSKLIRVPTKWAIYNEEDGFVSGFNALYKAEKALKSWKKEGRPGCSGPFEVGWATTVVIDVKGGSIQAVHANENIRVIIRDLDKDTCKLHKRTKSTTTSNKLKWFAPQ